MALHRIAEFCTARFIVCPNITSKFSTIAILNALSKKIIVQVKLAAVSMIVLYITSFV
jgi:hypothetical protein